MDAQPFKHAARPDPQAVEKRPEIVAGAVAAKLAVVLPLPATEPGSAFDIAMREKLARFESASRA